ncbi:Uncaracterized surface protein containing fasciclin (FAS1) repeats [Chryseobacterium arachidis]|uniref:Uncaracterized surface protein containing fasciclin (FAS1) repeats n=1 Tax=Chryseobacterium arachidis TaxID=1416778 RepID=A0A1M5DV03_9FLAO|nr:fasciclin domain-containing protein [Chryseobacterium arachidis]SHF70750.1 Uncaracterized surface protein containing fasciclin (FAS1) repeats [Chryseobacterium arachidis]
MKNLLKTFLGFLLLMVFVVSCDDNDDMPMDNGKSITDLVSENQNLSLLKVAVVRAGLAETLAANGNFTVFAPNNEAFQAAGLGTEAAINAVPVDQLKSILMYHVAMQKYASGDIPNGSTDISISNNQKLHITKNSSGVYVNGAKVVTADVMARNGVVHVIDKVLMPPTNNIVQAAQANPNLSYLVAAVTRASQGTTNVAALLSDANASLTVFAPTNQAFINAGFSSEAAINAANPNTLASILTYHVINAKVFSSDLTEGAMPTTINGAKVTISLTGGAKVKGNGNTTASNITAKDMVVTNGVVHVIDQVLLP